jgi:hypothetical protein
VPQQWNEELLFSDDTLVRAADRSRSASLGEFSFVKTPENRNGVLYVTHNFRLKPAADQFEAEIAHGIRACS